jgi:hypothetical protein
MQKRIIQILLPLALFLIFIIAMSAIEFGTPDLPDNDGFYHIKMAWLMRTEGLKPDFPWLPMSILNQDEFYDHHFLFHVALIPFTFDDLLSGAKWAAVIFAAIAFLSIGFLFKRQHVPYAWLWSLALLGISDAFLYRMSVTRAQSLSLAVLAIAIIWILEGKYKHLAVLSFLYVWMYDAFPLILGLAVLHMLAVVIVERRLELRPFIYILGGIILGLLINPYFPQNLIFSYRHMLPKLTDATAVRVGNEWYPYDTKQLLDNSLPSLVAFASGILALGLSERKMDVRTAFALLTSLIFGLMLFQARRFVEYFPPFSLIFAAFAWTPVLTFASNSSEKPQPRNVFAIAVLSIAIAISVGLSLPAAREAVNKSKPYDLYAGASLWLQQNTPQGSRVFQTDWDDFPRLFFYNTHNTYLAGLDPSYLQLYDPDMYDVWVEISNGNVEQPSKLISKAFDAQYVHTDLNHKDFLRMADQDPGLREVYRDGQAVIYEVSTMP